GRGALQNLAPGAARDWLCLGRGRSGSLFGRIKQRYANRHSLRPQEKDLKKTPGAWVLRWKKLSQCPCLSSNESDSRNVPFDDHCSPISLILLYIHKLCGGLRSFV